MRPFLAILGLAATLASPSFAATVAEIDGDDEVIATAQAKPTAQALTAVAPAATPTPAAKPMSTQEQIAAFLAANPAPELDEGPRGLVPADRDEDGRRKVHGSVSAAVGTGGYRSVSASALFPVGESATVGVAVSKTNCGKRGGGCYDPYYGGPGFGYGYGSVHGGYGYGPGYYGSTHGRGGERQSVALSVMAGDRQRADPPEGCAPGFRDGGRYVEPLWVEGLRDGAHPCAAAAPAR